MNKLIVKTDLQNKKWLKYLLEEFKRINLAKFDIEVIDIKTVIQEANVIYYANRVYKNSIFNSQEIKPNGNIKYLNENLFILENSISNLNFDIKYDLFWNAFVFLSRLEEQNIKTFSYSTKHIRKDKKSFYIPIVNVLFNELENFIKNKFNLKFEDKKQPFIDLSHDVDYIYKTWQLRFKQSVLNLYNLKWKKFIKFLFSNPSYWCFDYWQDLEKKYNKKSTFYVYVKYGKKTLKENLIDPSYDMISNKKLQENLKELLKNGFEIGLHGSYKSALNFEQLKKEKEILEEILGVEITKTRQHWLNYDENITPFSHNKLFRYDSTLAWNNQVGFRSGIASLYRPYNFKEEKAFDYFEIPQIIMDSNIFDYGEKDEIAFNIIQKAISIPKQPYFSISWHQRVCSNDYNWHIFYKEILNEYL